LEIPEWMGTEAVGDLLKEILEVGAGPGGHYTHSLTFSFDTRSLVESTLSQYLGRSLFCLWISDTYVIGEWKRGRLALYVVAQYSEAQKRFNGEDLHRYPISLQSSLDVMQPEPCEVTAFLRLGDNLFGTRCVDKCRPVSDDGMMLSSGIWCDHLDGT